MTQIVEESTITAKGQTTVPKAVRQALGVSSGDRIAFRIADGRVTVQRVTQNDRDPAIEAFLAFLALDMAARPQALGSVPSSLMMRATELTNHLAVDLDAPIEGDVDL